MLKLIVKASLLVAGAVVLASATYAQRATVASPQVRNDARRAITQCMTGSATPAEAGALLDASLAENFEALTQKRNQALAGIAARCERELDDYKTAFGAQRTRPDLVLDLLQPAVLKGIAERFPNQAGLQLVTGRGWRLLIPLNATKENKSGVRSWSGQWQGVGIEAAQGELGSVPAPAHASEALLREANSRGIPPDKLDKRTIEGADAAFGVIGELKSGSMVKVIYALKGKQWIAVLVETPGDRSQRPSDQLVDTGWLLKFGG